MRTRYTVDTTQSPPALGLDLAHRPRAFAILLAEVLIVVLAGALLPLILPLLLPLVILARPETLFPNLAHGLSGTVGNTLKEHEYLLLVDVRELDHLLPDDAL